MLTRTPKPIIKRLLASAVNPLLVPFLLSALTVGAANAQSFPSGSTGVDGDLIVNTAGVTNFATKPLNGGSVYNFRTIQIASGSTLRLSGAIFSSPLYFLAQGAVTIAGVIDLSGQNGTNRLFRPTVAGLLSLVQAVSVVVQQLSKQMPVNRD